MAVSALASAEAVTSIVEKINHNEADTGKVSGKEIGGRRFGAAHSSDEQANDQEELLGVMKSIKANGLKEADKIVTQPVGSTI